MAHISSIGSIEGGDRGIARTGMPQNRFGLLALVLSGATSAFCVYAPPVLVMSVCMAFLLAGFLLATHAWLRQDSVRHAVPRSKDLGALLVFLGFFGALLAESSEILD
jgi:hypothetical protein